MMDLPASNHSGHPSLRHVIDLTDCITDDEDPANSSEAISATYVEQRQSTKAEPEEQAMPDAVQRGTAELDVETPATTLANENLPTTVDITDGVGETIEVPQNPSSFMSTRSAAAAGPAGTVENGEDTAPMETDVTATPTVDTMIVDAEPKVEDEDLGFTGFRAPDTDEGTLNPVTAVNNGANAPNGHGLIPNESTQFPVEGANDFDMAFADPDALLGTADFQFLVEHRGTESLSDPFQHNGDDGFTNTGRNENIGDQIAHLVDRQDVTQAIEHQEQCSPAGEGYDAEEELANAHELFHSAAIEFSNDLNVNAAPQATIEEDMMMDVDIDEEDRQATAEFASARTVYERRRKTGMTSQEEDVEFRRRVKEEDQRRCRYLKQKEVAVARARETDTPMFFPEPARVSPPSEDEPFDFEANLEAALEMSPAPNITTGGRGRKRKEDGSKKGPTSRVTKSAHQEKQKSCRGRPKGCQSKRKHAPQYTSFLFNNDTIADAQANFGMADQPTFSSTTKKTALEELIASLPEDQRALHVTEKTELLKASKKFTGHGAIRAVPESPTDPGGWRLKGMKSALRHYQLLGVGFMRDRENSSSRPYGGFMADEMGLGKTVMAIANIVDGNADHATSGGQRGPTLIVCPSALISQWFHEVGKHADLHFLGQVMVYRTGSKLQSSDPVGILSGMAVVITSYAEVMRSWPKYLPPVECTSEELKQAWYRDVCARCKGPLHRVKFRRIVLDEAQAIKNRDSQTSKAVGELLGKFRWAISGTPVQNSLEEFYPYFKFLKLPHSDTWEQFQHNFCQRGNQGALNRLKSYLQKFMVRRTHQDQLFGRPILKLPDVSSATIDVKFNRVEKQIYQIVKTRFVNRIRAYVHHNKIARAYQSIFVLLLRLRQMVCHVLLIQNTLKDLLEPSDLEKLWALTENEGNVSATDGSRECLRGLRTALETAQVDRMSSTQTSARDSGPSVADQATRGIPSSGLAFKFRKCLEAMRQDGNWAEICNRSLCLACGEPPTHPYITSCMHVYCFVCLNDMRYSAAIQDDSGARCLECGIIFETAEPCQAFHEELGPGRITPQPGSRGKKGRSPGDKEEDLDWFHLDGPMLQSAKTKATVLQVQAWLNQDPDAKILIFTQWRGMISCLGRICEEQRWGYTVFHGEMAFEARDKAIQCFSDESDCKILLCAMKAGGVGLNLTAASRVIIMDLWWNQYVETQAFCRVFRIGQLRDVQMVRFVVADSVDTDILKMQARKNKEINNVMEGRFSRKKWDTRSLLALFSTSDEEEADGGGFVFSTTIEDGEGDD